RAWRKAKAIQLLAVLVPIQNRTLKAIKQRVFPCGHAVCSSKSYRAQRGAGQADGRYPFKKALARQFQRYQLLRSIINISLKYGTLTSSSSAWSTVRNQTGSP